MIIQDIAEKFGITEPFNGSWLAAIINYLGGDLKDELWKNWAATLSITEPVNGTWAEAIARHYGAIEPVNGSWIEAIELNIPVDTEPYWLLGYVDVDYIINS